ncbi:MAG TPA: copper transporter [Jiangellaceae bacterium]|nr:copper transporter [Jiangellaceae bacterium]
MIDFRYHLVSIIAVFFALAIGIVLGAGPLGSRVDENLPEQLAAVREENQALRGQIRVLEADQAFRDGFVDVVAIELVSDRLNGRDVVLVSMPEADDNLVEATGEMLEMSGATLTTTVSIEPTWTEPESEAALDALAAELVTSGITLPEDGTGYDRGAALLAGAFLRRPVDPALTNGVPGAVEDGAPAVDGQVDEEVLVGLQEADFIQLDGQPARKAGLAVVITGSPDSDDEDEDGAPENPLLALVDALERAGSGAVVAGPATAADTGGLIGEIRNDADLAERVSTVDSINLPGGRIAVVFATIEQHEGGAGQYGYLGASDGPIPPIPQRLPPPVEGDNGTEPPAAVGDDDDDADAAGADDADDTGDATGDEDGDDEDGA